MVVSLGCETLQPTLLMTASEFPVLSTKPDVVQLQDERREPRWSDLIDVDAGTIVTGDATEAEVGEQIFRMILDVASGRKQACADTLRLHNDLALFNPPPIT